MEVLSHISYTFFHYVLLVKWQDSEYTHEMTPTNYNTHISMYTNLLSFICFIIHRVWQEHRTAVVGWLSPIHGLFEDKNGTWHYKYFYSMKNCEYSMVLTNGAFFHKVYTITLSRNLINIGVFFIVLPISLHLLDA